MFVSEKEIEIRYAETDQMGVVYHANYLVWMEIGRTKLIEDLGFTYAGLEAEGYLSPVTDLSIKYKAAMRYGTSATIRTWIESHGKLRTTYGYQILHADGTVAATATSEHVVVRKDTFRPVSLRKIDPIWDAKYVEVANQVD
ncbi:acyl-CoA thioesterase [Sporosarcina aquimarina]|uniref:Thioesterase family protein n=1 Tax=Sporosarcina aquimarina TaxID=114975 RepID=A0ABU4G1D9_9BACL|nr:thioesterase family protein [Sporosarcina aquimarina]MDW0109477.1 thioesterase family protein [Sporosarcina aquimarina]